MKLLRLFLIACLLIIVVPSALSESIVCGRGSVKYNVGSGYEYGEELAVIAISYTEEGYQIVTWGSIDPFIIADVCVKTGGPGGGSLHSPPVDAGEWLNTTRYDISHVVLYTNPTSVVLARMNANSGVPAPGWQLILSLLALTAIVVLWRMSNKRRW